MDPHLERALEALRRAKERVPQGPRLDEELWAALRKYENAPWNQPRSDKSWVWRCLQLSRDHFRRVESRRG